MNNRLNKSNGAAQGANSCRSKRPSGRWILENSTLRLTWTTNGSESDVSAAA
ncbi:MAG: hypothetical protein ABI577_15985 [bacterium]